MFAVLADTGPLYAATDASDTQHARAQSELADFSRERRQVIVSFPTLLECYSLLARRAARHIVHRWLDEMSAAGCLVNPASADYFAAIRVVKTYADQDITLIDAVVAAISTRMELPIWTYDHHFDVMRANVWRPE